MYKIKSPNSISRNSRKETVGYSPTPPHPPPKQKVFRCISKSRVIPCSETQENRNILFQPQWKPFFISVANWIGFAYVTTWQKPSAWELPVKLKTSANCRLWQKGRRQKEKKNSFAFFSGSPKFHDLPKRERLESIDWMTDVL